MDFENSSVIENAAAEAEEKSGGNVFKYVAVFTVGVVVGVAGEKLVHRRAKKRAAKKAAKRAAEKLAAEAAAEIEEHFEEVKVNESKTEE